MTATCELVELGAQQGEHLARRDRPERGKHVRERVLNRHVPDKCYQEQQCRKEREKEVEGELRRQAQTVVLPDLDNGAIEHLRPTQRDSKENQHRGC